MSNTVYLNYSFLHRQNISVFLIWLFHLSGIIGISIGYDNWFITKTPINLSLILLLVLWSFPSKPIKFWLGFVLFFFGGMLLEWVGVHYGFLFGTYTYGENLGPRFHGVPWFIGINWSLLTLVTGVIATSLVKNTFARILLGAGLMVFLDFFLEYSAPVFDFWTFENGIAPLKNYIAWFGFSIIFHFIYQSLKLKGDVVFSSHLYAVQLIFFAYFYGFYYL